MVEQDTIRLLHECDAGIKMGISSINDVLNYTRDKGLYSLLERCKEEHNELGEKICSLLREYHDEGKNPNPIAKGMSKIKTNLKISVSESDKTVASLMTDGCNMGVKSLSKYLNQYAAADEISKDICKKLIKIEDQLSVDLRDYL